MMTQIVLSAREGIKIKEGVHHRVAAEIGRTFSQNLGDEGSSV